MSLYHHIRRLDVGLDVFPQVEREKKGDEVEIGQSASVHSPV